MNLPEGWTIANVDEFAGSTGLVADGDWVESKDQDSEGGVRLVQLADIGEGEFRDRSRRFMRQEVADRLRCTYLKPGDVLIARMPDPLGRACVFPGLQQPAVTAVDVMIWRTDGSLSHPDWFAKILNSPLVRSKMIEGASGTTRQRIAGGRIKEMTLPLPPLAEQRRIVAKLDTLTAHIARARAELDRVPQLAEKLRLEVLRAVFHWKAVDLPSGWLLKRLDEIGDVQLGRQRSPKDHEGPNMRPYLRAANITWTGWDLSDVKKMNFSPAEFKTFRLMRGDVLLNEGSGSAKEVGKPAVWNGDLKDVCFQNTLLRIRPREYDPDLLRYSLLFIARSGGFIANTQGVNIIHIGKAGLARTVIPVPPANQQRDLLELIEEAFARADRLEAEAARARALLDRLESAILAKAFRGELVRQDPNDEPASVLLERIRSQRTEASNGKRSRRSAAAASTLVDLS